MKAVILNADASTSPSRSTIPRPAPGRCSSAPTPAGSVALTCTPLNSPTCSNPTSSPDTSSPGKSWPSARAWRDGPSARPSPPTPTAASVTSAATARRVGTTSATSAPTTTPLGVAVDGGMAEYVAVDTAYLHALPEGMDTRRAAWTEPLAVAVRAVRTSPLRLGDTAAVIGGGPVGQLALQLLRLAGARRVVMVELSSFRRQMAMTLGPMRP